MASDDSPGNQMIVARSDASSQRAIRTARMLAIAADVLQLVLFPVFIEGFASVLDDVLDVVVGIVMVRLVGWHLAFLPAFVVKAVPVADLAPTWTLAVFLATRSKTSRPDLKIHEP
jgi:hypothetical protein